MALAIQEDHWDRTSCEMALLFNINSAKKKVDPMFFHPLRSKKRSGKRRTNSGTALSEFKRVLLPRQIKQGNKT